MYGEWRRGRARHGFPFWPVMIGLFAMITVLGHLGFLLIPLVAIVAFTALLWNPVQAITQRVGRTSDVGDSGGELRKRITALESQLESLSRDHVQLQETVRWQERLLQQTTSAAGLNPPTGRTGR